MKFNILQTVIIIIVIFALYSLFNFGKDPIIKTVTVTETITEIITDTIDNTKPTEIKKVYIKVPVTVYDTINNTIVKTDTIYKDKEVNKYVYKDSLANGLLTATILADNIYKRSIELSTFNTTTTTETTNTIVKSHIFTGVNVGVYNGVNNVNANIYYVHKDKWLLNGGIGYQLSNKKPIYNIGLALKF